jgi:leucyl aminopeptidase
MNMPKLKVSATPKINENTVFVLAAVSEDKKVKPARTTFSSIWFADDVFDTDFASVGASSEAESLTKVQLRRADSGSTVAALVGTTFKPNPFASFSSGWREIGGAIARKLSDVDSIVIDFGIEDPEVLAEFVEGLLLGAYEPKTFKTAKSNFALNQITVVSSLKLSKGALLRAETIARAVHDTRDLTNLPANHLHPADLAKAAQKAAEGIESLSVKVLDEKQLIAQGFGGISAVGAGAKHPPRLVHLSYRPKGAKKHLALVGKGITFDTGGLSLKPAASMLGMKYDMTGAAVVLHAIVAIAQLGLKLDVDAYMCIAENMPSGSATRPNDVITLRNKKTVEVINTDAEGRLVLADGLSLASESKPDLIVDVATLTGAVTVALGLRTAGLMGTTDGVIAVENAAAAAAEPVWVLPMPIELKQSLSSDIADQANAKFGANGGTILGAWFLSEFIGTDKDGAPLAWAHLDIAGVADNEGAGYGFTPKGGTGAVVRTLLELAESM